jgi:hypothetical protein
MTRLRRIMGTAFLRAIPQRIKDARMKRTLRRLTRHGKIPFPPWQGRFNDTGYQVLSQRDPMMSLPRH